MFTPTFEQDAVINEILNGDSDVVVEAGPGSGKTTTIVEAMKKLPLSSEILYVCFNKKNADEAQEKVTSNVDACTLNSLGFRILRKYMKGVKLNQYKTQNHLQAFLGAKYDKESRIVKFPSDEAQKRYYQTIGTVIRTVSLMKGNCITKPSKEVIEQIIEDYNIDVTTKIEFDEVIALIQNVFTLCVMDKKEIDFDDQIYLPVIHGWKLNVSFTHVFVDEAQDLNLAQFRLVEMVAGYEAKVELFESMVAA